MNKRRECDTETVKEKENLKRDRERKIKDTLVTFKEMYRK